MKTNTIMKFCAVLLGSAVLLSSCIKETFPEGGSATTEQVGESPMAADGVLTAMPTILMTNYLGVGQHFDFGYPGIMGSYDRLAGEVFPVSGNVEGGNQYYDRFHFTMYLGVGSYLNAESGWSDFWYSNYYQFLYPVNSAIAAFSSSSEASPELGICYAFRAFNYMDLARLFEPLPAVASGATGTVPYEIPAEVVGLTVPLVTETTTMQQLENNPRLPREQMWGFILSDLNKAETMLEGYTPEAITIPSQAVVYGLKARAYLWLGGYTEAIGDVVVEATGETINVPTGNAAYQLAAEYARKAITAEGGVVMSESEWLSPTTGFSKVASSWMWALTQSTDTVLNNLLSWTAHMSNDAMWGYGTLAQPGISVMSYERLNNTDFRKKIFVTPDQSYEAIAPYTMQTEDEFKGKGDDRSFEVAPYASFKFHTNGGEKYDYAVANVTDIPLMRVEEMYLIEAEATAHIDAGAGQSLLTAFMASRDSGYVIPAGVDIVDEIIFQKRIELWGEGLIFFDLKRLNYGLTTGLEASNSPTDARYVTNGRAPWWNPAIPLSAVQQNIGLQGFNNPNPSMTYLPINKDNE